MKRFYLLLTGMLVLCSSQFHAQSKISDRLRSAMTTAQNDGATVRTMVILSDQVDLLGLDRQLTLSNATPRERGYIVITQLQQKARSTQAGVLRLLQAKSKAEVPKYESFWIINAIAVEAVPNTVMELSALPEIAEIDSDDKVELIEPVEESAAPATLPGSAEPGLKVINAHKMWELGYTGQGVIVMNVDMGVNGLHPALRARWRGTHVPWYHAWRDPAAGTTFPTDTHGHGTHTMGTMTGVDTTTYDTIGVAPSAEWIAGRAGLDDPTWTASNTLSILQWALDPDSNANTSEDRPAVINNSWSWNSLCSSSFAGAITALEAAGIAVVFAAGNSGPGSATVVSPGKLNFTEMNVFSVGAIQGNRTDLQIAPFSSRGPTNCTGAGNQIKPEVSAPGVQVRSSHLYGSYLYGSGTSMATPHVCGAVALLKQAFPNKTGTQLKQLLYETARDLGTPGEDNTYGMGVIDVYQAYIQNAVPENPRPPRDFAAYGDYITPTTVSLTWTDPTRLVSGDTLTNYQIQVWRDGAFLTSVGAHVQHYTDSSLTDGILYGYQLLTEDLATTRLSVPAVDSVYAGGSPYPSPPTSLSCMQTLGRARLVWTDPTTQSDGTPLDDLAKILVYRDHVLIDSVLAGVRTYDDLGVFAGHPYRYFLRAVDNEVPCHMSDPGGSALCYIGARPEYLVWVGPNTDWLGRDSGDSLFEAVAANRESVFLTDSLFEFGTNLSSYKAIFVALGVYPLNHILAASAPEGPALNQYLLGGGRIYLEGGDCFNYDPGHGGYNIRPWFSLNSGVDGAADVFGVVGRDSLSRFSFRYAGDNKYMDPLQPSNSRVIWLNSLNTNVCGVFYSGYGTGRSIGVVPSFGGLVDSGMQVAPLVSSGREVNAVKGTHGSKERRGVSEKKEFVKKFAFRPEMGRNDARQLLRFTSEGISMLANTKRDLMAAYLHLFEDTMLVVTVAPSWNLVSVPLLASDFMRTALFPSSISQALLYQPGFGYEPRDTLANGVGYWLKFPATGSVPMMGAPLNIDSVSALTGWNLIGSISTPVPVASIGSIPGGIVTSPFYTYGTMGYEQASTITPGKGYWVKVTQPGSLVLSSIPSPMEKIRIVATGEMPPAPPCEVTAEETPEKPREFALAQNYPNPFNSVSNFEFRIPQSGMVELTVFDMLGQAVATLVNEPKEPGVYAVQWDASGVSSGVYFYRLRAGDFVQTKRMMVVR